MDTKTHKKVTELAINYLNYDLFNKVIDNLIFYSAQPDFDETGGAFKYHFYNPSTNKNYAGEYDSALSRFVKYYNKAVAHYGINVDEYTNYLGRSLHYLVDLNTPVHTYNQDAFDAVVNVYSHTQFESKCDELIDNFNENNAKIDNIDYFVHNRTKTIGLNAALKASLSFYKLSNYQKNDCLIKICNESISNSIITTIGMLYKFDNEVRRS